jgi:hypothetical protein
VWFRSKGSVRQKVLYASEHKAALVRYTIGFGRGEFVNTSRLKESRWLLVSIFLMVGAAVALVTRHFDAAFVLAALGAASWFLGLRTDLKSKLPADEAAPEEDEVKNED